MLTTGNGFEDFENLNTSDSQLNDFFKILLYILNGCRRWPCWPLGFWIVSDHGGGLGRSLTSPCTQTRRFLAAQTGDAAQAVVVAALRKAGVVAAVDEALPQAPKVVRRQVWEPAVQPHWPGRDRFSMYIMSGSGVRAPSLGAFAQARLC
jgi:hypothetical protein